MKLIKEYTYKLIISMVILVIFLEAIIFFFVYNASYKTFNKTVSDTLERSKQKTTELSEEINNYVINLLMNYITKLNLISKHSQLFNGKNGANSEIKINKNSKIFLSNNLKDKILEAKTEEINKHKVFNKVYNTETQQFDYVEYLNQKFLNENDNSKILNIIQKEHDELNYLSYYNNTGPTNINNLDDDSKKKFIFMIPIFKTLYVQRFIAKKTLDDIIRIILLNEKELIIYPPEDYNKINLHNFHYLYPASYCSYYEQNTGNYYLCAYNYIYNILFRNKDLELFVMEVLEYQTLLCAICIKFSFYKEKPLGSILCIEVNFRKIIQSINLQNAKNFNFGFFNPIIIDLNLGQFHYYLKDIYIIENSFRDAFKEFKEVYNSTEYTPYDYVLDDYDPIKIFKYYSLYHFLYLDTTKILKAHPELNMNITQIGEEYELIKNMTFTAAGNRENPISKFKFNKTTCRKKLTSNNYECFIDEADMNIIPLVLKINKLNDDIVYTNNISIADHNLFIYSIIYTNPAKNDEDIKILLNIKLIRIILLYVFMIFIIISIFYVLIDLFSSYTFEKIENIYDSMTSITANEQTRKINLLPEIQAFKANKEMKNLSDIYDILRNSLIIKEVFDNQLSSKKQFLEFYSIVQDINDKNIKEICNSFLAISHFNKKLYSLAENEFLSTINFLKELEMKILIGDEYDKIKEEIKRSSTVSYLNEFNNFENIDENIMKILHLNIYKQKFIYLYAMTKFHIGNNEEIKKDNKNKDKIKKYYKEAIKYFQESKEINELLGINKIKIIYALIMISKCHLFLKDYKNSIIAINQALSLYFNFSKSFNNYHSKYYNPKIMLFVETNLFHQILFTLAKICITFNKPCASNYIILKIFETSPFLLNNVHLIASLNFVNFLEKNRTKLNKYDKNFYKNITLVKEYENNKKYFTKISSRLSLKNEKQNEINATKSSNSNTKTVKSSLVMTNIKSDFASSRISSMYYKRNKKMYKNVTICISEKNLEKINGNKFRHVLIKYLKKYFTQNENDKFSYFQFATNGKITFFFKPSDLSEFTYKFQKIKFNNTESNNSLIQKKSKNNDTGCFEGLYDILYSAIKNLQINELSDNIIILFMNSEDIRFSSEINCINIVEELNKNNSSVYFFCFDKVVDKEKINNLQSFLNGLNEGYFLMIKKYEQMKYIFINLSNNKHQSNLLKFDFECFDFCL